MRYFRAVPIVYRGVLRKRKEEWFIFIGEGINEDLPRIDICSTKISKRIPVDRGLLHSPNYPHSQGKYVSCKKQLYILRKSRLRLFMHEKSIQHHHELNIRLLHNEPNTQRTLAKNELFDTNITDQQKDEFVEIELKTNYNGSGHFLLYFQGIILVSFCYFLKVMIIQLFFFFYHLND